MQILPDKPEPICSYLREDAFFHLVDLLAIYFQINLSLPPHYYQYLSHSNYNPSNKYIYLLIATTTIINLFFLPSTIIIHLITILTKALFINSFYFINQTYYHSNPQAYSINDRSFFKKNCKMKFIQKTVVKVAHNSLDKTKSDRVLRFKSLVMAFRPFLSI